MNVKTSIKKKVAAKAKPVKAATKKEPSKVASAAPAPAKKTGKGAPSKAQAHSAGARGAKAAAAAAPPPKPAKKVAKKKAVSKFGKKDLDLFRKLLLEKQQEFTASYKVSKGDSRSALDNGTEDYIDYAVSSYAKEFLLSLSELDRKQLLLVQEALRRIDRGEYGLCLQCGQEIPRKRLEVAPWVRHCVRCQELEEQGLLPQSSHSGDVGDLEDATLALDDEYEGPLRPEEEAEEEEEDEEEEEEDEHPAGSETLVVDDEDEDEEV